MAARRRFGDHSTNERKRGAWPGRGIVVSLHSLTARDLADVVPASVPGGLPVSDLGGSARLTRSAGPR